MTVRNATASTVIPESSGIQSPLARALETHFLSKLEYLNAIGIALFRSRRARQ